MIRLKLDILITITDQLRSFQRELLETPDAVIDPVEHSIVQLKQCHELFTDLKLKISGKHFHRMIAAIDQGGFTYGQCATKIDTLITLIIDELSEKLILQIWDHKRNFYDDPFPFRLDLPFKWPSVSFDVAEAAKCFATERDTACVFHLMRVMEMALVLLAKDLGLPSEDANWNKILDRADKMLRDVRDHKEAKPPDWKDKEVFYSQACALLRNVKNAWRNDVMHLEKKYTSDEAALIFQAVKLFIEFLAEELEEPKPVEVEG
jgi:hypothetical protein